MRKQRYLGMQKLCGKRSRQKKSTKLLNLIQKQNCPTFLFTQKTKICLKLNQLMTLL
nr:MAG TPA: hypothetical protein [Herelleviridae sp.]